MQEGQNLMFMSRRHDSRAKTHTTMRGLMKILVVVLCVMTQWKSMLPTDSGWRRR